MPGPVLRDSLPQVINCCSFGSSPAALDTWAWNETAGSSWPMPGATTAGESRQQKVTSRLPAFRAVPRVEVKLPQWLLQCRPCSHSHVISGPYWKQNAGILWLHPCQRGLRFGIPPEQLILSPTYRGIIYGFACKFSASPWKTMRSGGGCLIMPEDKGYKTVSKSCSWKQRTSTTYIELKDGKREAAAGAAMMGMLARWC